MTPTTQKAKTEDVKNSRTREGVVMSDKMDKTIVVQVTRLMQHAKFKKVIRSKVKYVVHDQNNQAKAGDKVRISMSRPLSQRKRWRLVKVIK